MIPASYPASRAAAILVHPHFVRHPTDAPGVDTIEAIIDAAFWASLRREEGYVPRISLAFAPPDEVKRPLRFERPLRLTPETLTRVSPAVLRPGIHLGVWRDGDDLLVWGATRKLPAFSFVLEVLAPGLLVIKHSRSEESGKFVNVAVIEGDRIKIIDQGAASLPDCPALLYPLLGLESQFAADESASVLIQLAVSMREHGRGGLLLVVPENGSEWQESILQPITYSIVPRFTLLAELAEMDPDGVSQGRWQDAMRRAVDGIGGLTAVDGATIINERYELLAFGAKMCGARWLSQLTDGAPRVPRRKRWSRRKWAVRDICRRRSSHTISGMRSHWWRRRMDNSACLDGLRASRWFTRTGSKVCCYESELRSDLTGQEACPTSVEARTTSLGSSKTVLGRDGDSFSSRARAIRAVRSPMASLCWSTLVSGTRRKSAYATLPQPAMATSSGTRRPASSTAFIAPMAVGSL